MTDEKQEAKTETNPFVVPVEAVKTSIEPTDTPIDSKESLKNDLVPEPVIAQEVKPEISQEKPIEVTPFTPVEEPKEEMSGKTTESAQIMKSEETEPEVAAIDENKEESENPLLPHYFAGKSSEASSANTTEKSETSSDEDKSDSSERKSFWGF